jgi:predicted flavoprotein YhiN
VKTISIIWAGAAGLMTAARILEDLTPNPSPSERGISETNNPINEQSNTPFHLHLFEKNPSPGKKVIISWWGRCNLTTGIEDKKILLSKYTRGSDFIRKALGKFSPRKCREWFESHGVPLKIESDNRVFPVSDDGRDIVEVFEHIFAKHRNSITLHYGKGVVGVSVIPAKAGIQSSKGIPLSLDSGSSPEWQEKQKFLITTTKWTYESDILVITTGGNAYSHTGSSGDGYAFARNLGHTVTELWPSLSSFLTRKKWMHELSGLALQNSQLKINNLQLSWPLLLTHFGISGPLTFQLSSHLAWEEIKGKEVLFSPIAEMDYLSWNTFLKEQFGQHPKKLITTILTEKLPRRFAEAFVNENFSQLRETFAASISREDREKIAKLLWEGISITLLERRPGDEFVTAGWVDTDEVNPETFESKLHKNLYFAGEVLNVDAVTGGYNLQACWAGGYTVGHSIEKSIL